MSGAVEWCKGAWRRDPTPAEALLIDVVCEGFGTGPWNVPALRAGRVEAWDCGASFCYGGDLATWDASRLMGIVCAGHDRCARVEIAPAGQYLRITVHLTTRGHPTLEQAVAAWREHHPLPVLEGSDA